MQISVAYALKEKKRLVGEIAHLWCLFQNENSCLETHKRKVDVKQTLQTIEHYTAKLVELKTKISSANQGEHLRNMQRLEEIRKKLANLAEINGSEDPQLMDRVEYSIRVSDIQLTNGIPQIRRTAVFNEEKLEEMRRQLRSEAAALQDLLDAHNAKTCIEFETPLK